jgi:hypothetical protein
VTTWPTRYFTVFAARGTGRGAISRLRRERGIEHRRRTAPHLQAVAHGLSLDEHRDRWHGTWDRRFQLSVPRRDRGMGGVQEDRRLGGDAGRVPGRVDIPASEAGRASDGGSKTSPPRRTQAGSPSRRALSGARGAGAGRPGARAARPGGARRDSGAPRRPGRLGLARRGR